MLWKELRAAILDACDSYKEHYGNELREAECQMENDHRIRITVRRKMSDSFGPSVQIVVVSLNKPDRTIHATSNHRSLGGHVHCNNDGVYFVADDQRVSADELCQMILEPILFHARITNSRTVAPVVSRASS